MKLRITENESLNSYCSTCIQVCNTSGLISINTTTREKPVKQVTRSDDNRPSLDTTAMETIQKINILFCTDWQFNEFQLKLNEQMTITHCQATSFKHARGASC